MTTNENPNSGIRKLEYYLSTIQRQGFLEILANWKVWTMKSMSMYSTQYLVGAPFALNYCSNAAWHGVDQSVALLRCYESPGCSDSGLQLFCIVGSGISHLLFTLPHRFSMGLRSGEFAGQLRTGIPWSLNQVLVALALCAGAKSCWKMKSASP